MATSSGHQIKVGLRNVRVYEILSNGYPGNSTTAGSVIYEGYKLNAAQSLSITWPEPRVITAVGDDRIQVKDVLPATEGAKGTLTAARMDHDIYAILTGTKELIDAESSQVGINTNQQGTNPQVGFMATQQAIDTSTGARSWNNMITPKAIVYPLPGAMDENSAKTTFSVTPMIVNKHLWGNQMSVASDGYTTTEGIERQTTSPLWVTSWVTSGSSTTVFTFNPLFPAATSTKIAVYADSGGTNGYATMLSGSSITPSTTGFTLAVGLPASSNVIARYETTGAVA